MLFKLRVNHLFNAVLLVKFKLVEWAKIYQAGATLKVFATVLV